MRKESLNKLTLTWLHWRQEKWSNTLINQLNEFVWMGSNNKNNVEKCQTSNKRRGRCGYPWSQTFWRVGTYKRRKIFVLNVTESDSYFERIWYINVIFVHVVTHLSNAQTVTTKQILREKKENETELNHQCCREGIQIWTNLAQLLSSRLLTPLTTTCVGQCNS